MKSVSEFKMKTIIATLPAAFLLASLSAQPAITLADAGKAKCPILLHPGTTPAEQYAAKELAETLQQITGAQFTVGQVGARVPRRAILVGPGPAAQSLFPGTRFEQLGQEEILIRTKGNRLLLAGGRPRGTLYAVAQFLQTQCGVRWWTPWASRVPSQPSLVISNLNVRYRPPFESRDPFWYPAFNRDWAVRNFSNSQSAHLTPEVGGAIVYKGFVHTFYPLVPPEKHFATHPEWYSLVNGKRTTDHAQLCLTNPQLRDFVVARVKEWLRESPEARIVSVSQNDWHGACECAECRALDDAEGSHAGSLLAFVNDIAERIEPEFPQVAIDTLAYQYTRKPPKTIKPRPNVIVRLCSIECDFREPLEAPRNAAFARDIEGWAKICQRLYIWDYTTDFAHYVQPHPNWFTLGPNIRFFQRHNVRGVFEQGAYQSFGSEMTELRAWVLAQLLWNPQQDDRALINEFLDGYYGPAAPSIREYLKLMYDASSGHNLTCFSGTQTRFLEFKHLAAAEQLWQQAQAVVANDPELLARVRLAHLPVGYAWLALWTKLRQSCRDSGASWPLPASRKAAAAEWLKVANGVPELNWTKVSMLSESGLKPEKFVERLGEDPPEPAP